MEKAQNVDAVIYRLQRKYPCRIKRRNLGTGLTLIVYDWRLRCAKNRRKILAYLAGVLLSIFSYTYLPPVEKGEISIVLLAAWWLCNSMLAYIVISHFFRAQHIYTASQFNILNDCITIQKLFLFRKKESLWKIDFESIDSFELIFSTQKEKITSCRIVINRKIGGSQFFPIPFLKFNDDFETALAFYWVLRQFIPDNIRFR